MSYSEYINSSSLANDVNISLTTHSTYFYEERMCRTFSIIYGIRACRFCKYTRIRINCGLKELSRLYEFVV